MKGRALTTYQKQKTFQGTPYCAGLPFVSARAMLPEERAQLTRWAWRLIAQGMGAFAASVAGPVLMIRYVVPLITNSAIALYFAITMALALLFFPLLTLLSNFSWLRRGIDLFRDLRQGSILECAGVLVPQFPAVRREEAKKTPVAVEAAMFELANARTVDVTQRMLLGREFLIPDAAQTQTLSVLPLSRRVWRANGAALAPWIVAEWREAPKPSEIGEEQALISRLSESQARRSLLPGERDELRHAAWGNWFWLALLLVIAVGLTIAGVLVKPNGPWWLDVHYYFAAIAAGGGAIKRWKESAKMREDAETGEVVTSADGRDELLPISRRLWMRDNRPAEWRKRR
ncbi:MAG: hypothetical protein ABIY70_17905 [Capsulimonas sp.]|uniref:hypothetical protein n=1 Tax=Capsulimonas sp. TaxID=2494211 RepID=UPI003262DBA8